MLASFAIKVALELILLDAVICCTTILPPTDNPAAVKLPLALILPEEVILPPIKVFPVIDKSPDL